MKRPNQLIRQRLKEKKIYVYQLAEALGIRETKFTIMLRHEFPEDLKDKCLKIIDSLEPIE